MASTYEVSLTRDEGGAWLARVPSVPGCHTHGRSIEQAMNRIREALSLWVDDAATAHLQPDVRLPEPARSNVRRLWAARERAESAEADARDLLVETVRELTRGEGWSVRDVAGVVGLSPQRIHQVSHELPTRRRSAKRSS
jgi:predicted RNase H-like HicB family nuclease